MMTVTCSKDSLRWQVRYQQYVVLRALYKQSMCFAIQVSAYSRFVIVLDELSVVGPLYRAEQDGGSQCEV
jgi:hypothetical protein